MAVAPFVLLLLLLASRGAVGGDDGAGQPHLLQLHGIDDPGRGHTSDALVERLQSTDVCGRFAALLATTANSGEIFRDHFVTGAGTGLTVFCPDDVAVAAFEPKFQKLSGDDQLAVVLLHFAAARYGREQIAAFDSVSVSTLAVDAAATNKSHVLTVLNDGETMWLRPSSRSRGSCGAAARVTAKEEAPTSGEFPFPLTVYVVDAVLLPSQLDGEAAAACTSSCPGGYLGWLHHTVPVWGALCIAASTFVGALVGFFLSGYFSS